MKTLCFAVTLLLLATYCCYAMPRGVLISTTPGNCCFNFFNREIPMKNVQRITKTHNLCPKKAFVVQTIRGREICFSQTFQWALDAYNQVHGVTHSQPMP